MGGPRPLVIILTTTAMLAVSFQLATKEVKMSEHDPIPMEQRAITLAENVMAARKEKDKQKFPAESTREEIIAAAFLRKVRN